MTETPEIRRMKIVFLDIDGPMIPATMYLIDMQCSWQRKFPATTVAVLNEICERCEASIVFNTTHNQPMKDVPDIGDALVAHGLKPEYIHPDDSKTRYPSLPRDIAVKEWLARHGEVTHWIALDDVRFTDEPNLIWVDPDAGLHIGHLNLAAELLEGKPCLILI